MAQPVDGYEITHRQPSGGGKPFSWNGAPLAFNFTVTNVTSEREFPHEFPP
jgi:hypothetical protein